MSWHSSLVFTTPTNALMAAVRAWDGSIPSATRSATFCSTWNISSSLRAESSSFRRTRDCMRFSKRIYAASCIAQNLCNRSRHAAPGFLFARELFAALRTQFVEFCPAPVFRGFPLSRNPFQLLHAVKGGVERAFLNAKSFLGNLLDALRKSVAMKRAASQHFQDEKVKRALQLVFSHAVSPRRLGRVCLAV